jgi:enoyl-CoA hydratase/carnithine racemase
MSDPVRVDRDGAVAVLTIDHPPANAVSRAVIAGLREAVAAIGGEGSGVRAAILTGQGGKFFAAGADITEFPTVGEENIAAGQALTLEMEQCPVPLIAAVNGIALGGGCELAMACDLRIAAANARFGQPEINLGIIPGWGGTQRLPRLIGLSRALPLLLTGDPIDAATALNLGLVSAVVEPGELLDAARALAATIATKAPLAVRATKRAVHQGLDAATTAEALAVERREFTEVFGSADAGEGVAAFLAKRAPEWRGR